MKVFRWKKAPGSEDLAPHELRLVEQPEGRIKLLLVLRKKTPQTLELTLEGTTEVFEDVWRRNFGDGVWKQASLYEEGNHFFCIRYLGFLNRWIVWRVEHIDGVSYDVFTTYQGTFSEMLTFYART